MKKFQAKRIAKCKKIRIADGYLSRLVTADDLVELCGYSRSQANRIINGKNKLPDHMRELLMMKIAGSIPGYPNGYYTVDGAISCPNGFKVYPEHMENFSFFMKMMNQMFRDMERLKSENCELKEKIKDRSEVRVYVNDGKEPEKTIRLVK